MKISIPLLFNMKFRNKKQKRLDTHTKKKKKKKNQYNQVINKIPVLIMLRWKMVLAFALYKYNMT